MTLIDHPEYNSTIILRTEIISDEVLLHHDFETSKWIPPVMDYSPTRNIHRKLLPRRPGRDDSLDQDCTFYVPITEPVSLPSLLVLTPRVPETGSLPYYHPAVAHLAFRYVAIESASGSSISHLVIEIDPLEKNASIGLETRIYRTCLSLLEALDRYGWGAMSNYQKRVIHDVLVPRNAYQDLYIIMKERHKSLVSQWSEVTDPLKHVFEVKFSLRSYFVVLNLPFRTLELLRFSCYCGKIPTMLMTHPLPRATRIQGHGMIGLALQADLQTLGIFSI